MEKLKVLDLFSGIGGFSLGLERTGGFETVAFCEIEPYCRRVLAKHWPGVKQYDDVRTLTADTLARDGIAVDVICGGFPCQDISVAGRGAGLAGERSGLWSEYARLIGELRPRFVIVENVAALLSRGLGDVLRDLAALGFDAEWHCIPAAAVGAPHRRDRIWIVANANEARLPIDQRRSAIAERNGNRTVDSRSGSSGGGHYWRTEPNVGRVAHGIPSRVDRLGALGNAVVPQVVELIGHAILEAEGMSS
jgi:DNA (cytosine-5)-methyltransferase 1